MAIGRDHIASTIYTIVFANAVAALPLLMLVEIYPRPLWTVLTGADIGEEIVRTLVGVIALVLSVPLTTAVGALLATATRHRPAASPSAHRHAHHHWGDHDPFGSGAGAQRTNVGTGQAGIALAPNTRPAMPALPPPPP